jgi:UTP--glucose-1-phosphate uridylyltransferase
MKITKAILPVAGVGTRFLPATKAIPKALLPIFDTPAIQLIVDDLLESGIKEIIIVTNVVDCPIKKYFAKDMVFENFLRENKKIAEIEQILHRNDKIKFHFVIQEKPLGDGDAILRAREFCKPDEAVLVCFGDDLCDNVAGKNSVQQLLDVFEKTKKSVILCEKIDPQETEKYGIVDFKKNKDFAGQISQIVEKPSSENAPSDFGVIGKYILTPDIFTFLEKVVAGPDGEIRLANAFSLFLETEGVVFSQILEGKRFDVGDKVGYLQATCHYARKKYPDLRSL